MAVMDAGHIRQLGTPVEVFRRPANLFVAGFIGSTPMNLLEATVDDGGLRVGRSRLPLPAGAGPQLSAGDKVVVGVRPEYAELTDGERSGAIAGRVTLLESLGSAFLVTVDSDGVLAQVTVPEGRQPAVGDRAFVVPDPERLLVYRADDGELLGVGQPAQDAAAQGLRATPP
jgi:multiple sugar transport system ATP-binding protein